MTHPMACSGRLALRIALLGSVLAGMMAPCSASAQGLAELYSAALRGNAILKVREYETERARAESDGARSRLLPQVLAQGGVSRNEYRDASVGTQNYPGKRASLNLRQVLYEPALLRRLEATQAVVMQRDFELAFARLALFDEVLDRYLQALAAQDELAWLGAESQAATRQVDRLRAMRERQMAKVTDLAEADAYAQGLVTRTIDARNQQAVALARLTELCGMPVAKVPALSRTKFEVVAGTQGEWVSQAQAGYPRLLALAQALDAAKRYFESSRAEHLPQLVASLSRIYADQGFDNRRQTPYHVTSIGIELRVPLYEGGRVEASVREAAARQGAAEQQLEAARREVERETITHWLNAQANHARIGSTEAEVAALEQTVRSQEIGLDLGVSRINDLLDARRRLLKARADQSKARYDYVRDVVALKLRSGGPSEEDIVLWDKWFDTGG